MMPECNVGPVDTLPSYASLENEEPKYLKQTVMLKLNGGLGTGMGLEQAKSLLDLKAGDTFLDFIAKQVRLDPAHANDASTCLIALETEDEEARSRTCPRL